MACRLVVNIRGANASGKTTLARNFLKDQLDLITTTAPDGTKVDYQVCRVPGLSRMVTLIGRYDESKYSGCDRIKSADAICWAVSQVTGSENHVLFEGFRVSKSYARFAALRNELVREHDITWLWALLHAPKELIFERAAARREDGKLIDKKELTSVCGQMDGTRTKLRQAFHGDVLTLDPRRSPRELYTRLVDEMTARERGATLGST